MIDQEEGFSQLISIKMALQKKFLGWVQRADHLLDVLNSICRPANAHWALCGMTIEGDVT